MKVFYVKINKVRLRCVLGYVSTFYIIAKEYGRRKKEKDLIFVVGLVFYCYCTYNPANSVFSLPNKQVAKLHLVLDCKKYFYNKPLLKFWKVNPLSPNPKNSMRIYPNILLVFKKVNRPLITPKNQRIRGAQRCLNA